jgi:hypothetical protein
MKNMLPIVIEGLIDQVLDVIPAIPQIVKTPVTLYMNGRTEAARDILLKRIAEGEIDPFEAASDDSLIGVIYTYIQCAQKGLARANLDLLSQAIAGEMKRDRIYPDKFHKYINALSSLTRDEIFLLGRYLRIYRKLTAEAKKQNTEFFNNVTSNAWNECKHTLVPQHFESIPHMEIVLYRLLGSGFLHPPGAVLGGGLGTPNFTILLHDIAEIVDFEKSYGDYPDY